MINRWTERYKRVYKGLIEILQTNCSSSHLFQKWFGRVTSTYYLTSPTHLTSFPTRPVTLPATHSTLAHAALLFHALFSIPQVKLSLARFRPSPTASNSTDEMTWALTELFVAMEFGCIGQLTPDAALEACGAKQEGWTTVAEEPGALTGAFYRKIVGAIELSLDEQFRLSGQSGPQCVFISSLR